MARMLHAGCCAVAPRVQPGRRRLARGFVLAMLAALAAMAPQRAAASAAVAAPREAYADHVSDAARRFGIPERWIWHVMHVESRGKPRAVSSAGAMGLMQIMPATWSMLSARHNLGADPFDARANILAGAAYLRAMWDRYRTVPLMLAAYNAGPGRADAYAAGRRRLPAETTAYVARLAPALATGSAVPAPPARSAPRSWRDAALFSGPLDRVDDAADEAGVPRGAPEPHPLFVPLSGHGR